MADYFVYEKLLMLGWRRSGRIVYCYQCSGCRLCIPMRICADRFVPSKSLKRILKKNADITVSLSAPFYSEERFNLYKKYVSARHDEPSTPQTMQEHYLAFVDLTAGSNARIVEYRDPSDILLAEGFVDILPNSISSVYFAFLPEAGIRSLGRFSVHAEIQLAEKLKKDFYYLGFWVPGAKKMDYKADFSPFELAVDAADRQIAEDSSQKQARSENTSWRQFSSRSEALQWLENAGYLAR